MQLTAKHQEYWSRNLRVTAILLFIWFFVTFVLGGWGGSQVGISCIDGYDASENTTGSSQRFENGRWYRVRIEVRTKEIKVLLDGRPIVLTNIAGRTLGLRSGEIERCVPFGFATFGTEGRVRGCVVERL